MTKAESDWFLRGGKRPEREPDTITVEVAVCQNCGGHNLPGDAECTHCGSSLAGDPSTEEFCGCDYSSCPECGARLDGDDICPVCGWEPQPVDDRETREFRVRIVASQPVETFMIVTAADEEDACDKVADILNNDGEFDPEAQDWDPVGSVDDPEIDDTDVTEEH